MATFGERLTPDGQTQTFIFYCQIAVVTFFCYETTRANITFATTNYYSGSSRSEGCGREGTYDFIAFRLGGLLCLVAGGL